MVHELHKLGYQCLRIMPGMSASGMNCWYIEMPGHAERGDLPVAYADWYEEPDPRWLPTTRGFESGLPMPPPGEAEPV